MLTTEECSGGFRSGVRDRIIDMLPSVTQVIKAIYETKDDPIFSQGTPEYVEMQVDKHLMPTFQEMHGIIRGGVPNLPGSDEAENWLHGLAFSFTYGLLAPTSPHALVVLHRLQEHGTPPISTGATLALAYADDVPATADVKPLLQAISTKAILFTPIRMYPRVLAGMTPIFKGNPQLSTALLEAFKSFPQRADAHRLETVIFLAELGVANQAVVNEFVYWTDQSSTEPHTLERCFVAVARWIESDKNALALLDELTNRVKDERIRTSHRWKRAFRKLNPELVSTDVFDFIKQLFEQFDNPYGQVALVEAIAKFTACTQFSKRSSQFILGNLSCEPGGFSSKKFMLMRNTLRGLWVLKPVDKAIRQRVLALAGPEGEKLQVDICGDAVETLCHWGLTDKQALKAIEAAINRKTSSWVSGKASKVFEEAKLGKLKQSYLDP